MALIKNALAEPEEKDVEPAPEDTATAEPAKAEPTKEEIPASANEGEAATPAEQDAYTKCVLAGVKILYDKATHQGIMNMLKSGGDPSKAMADTVAMLMVQIDEKSGGKVPEVVILPAAADLLSEVAELATKAKLFPVDEKTVGTAMQMLVINLAEQYDVNPQDLQAIMQSIPKEQIQQMVAQQGQYSAAPKAAQTPAEA